MGSPELWQELLLSKSIFPPGDCFIVPSDLVLFEIRQFILNESPHGVILYPKLYTIGALEQSLASELGLRHINPWKKTFFLESMVTELWQVLQIPDPMTLKRRLELADELADALDRIRLSGISWKEVEALEPTSVALTLSQLGERYEAWLSDNKTADRAQRRRAVIDGLRSGRSFSFLKDTKRLKFLYFQRLSPFETELLSALASRYQVDLTLNGPGWLTDDVELSRAGSLRIRLIEELEKLKDSQLTLKFSRVESREEENDSFRNSKIPSVLLYASNNLFGPVTKEPPPPMDDSLCVIEATDPYMEVESVLRLLKKEIVEGCLPHRLALVVPNLHQYLPRIEDVARRFGLKFFHRRGIPLEGIGPIVAFLDLLALFGSDYERTRVIRLFSSPYFDFGLTKVPILELLEAGITDDRGQGGFVDNLEKYPYEDDSSDVAKLLSAVKRLKEIEESILKAKTWKEFFQVLSGCLKEFSFGPKKLAVGKENSAEFPAEYSERETLGYNTLIELFEELQEAFTRIPEAPEVGLDTFRLFLHKAISTDYIQNSIDTNPIGKIRLLNYYELQGAYFDTLFLLGLNHGVFPKGTQEGVFWPKAFVEGFRKLRIKSLWTNSYERYHEQEEIVAAALAQGQKVYLSYSAKDANNKLTNPSPLVEGVKDLWPKDTFTTLKMGSEVPPPGDILADPSELFIYLKSLGKEERKRVTESLGKSYSLPEDIFKDPALKISQEEKRIPSFIIKSFLARSVTKTDEPILSIGVLADYTHCPKLFWYEKILSLETFPEELEEYSHLNRGILLHATLEEFLRPLVGKDGKASPSLFSKERLIAILEEKAQEMAQKIPLGREPIYRRILARLTKQLILWLQRQENIHLSRVLALEWEFPLVKIDTKYGSFYLKGRADRVDTIDGKIHVKDYKLNFRNTYKVSSKSTVPATSTFALNVYALAAEEHYKGQSVSASFEFIHYKAKEPSEVPLLPVGKEFFAGIYERLYEGILEQNPDYPIKNQCDYCPYYNICPRMHNEED
ncbi:MAG: PD-(D/E)XK nuclease family protein [Deltaproteobacteria bacterium]|jgi:ATP-dependent helicase/DNAse subunit B|nr:PD-(D/E)XK nuclease family protein [Deltaproteobacteria bacterium]